MNTVNANRNSLLARLLASENLTVEHSPDCQTAYFELDARRLVLPQWDNKDQSVYDFLVGHEVGHAKYTPADQWKDASIRIGGSANAMIAKDYINVIEDARIERMIKREFPGLRRDFINGYQALSTMDAFNITGRDLTALSFIDRLNLHFKMGVHLGVQVPFSAEEMTFVDRINTARTFDDVVQIASEVYELAKQQKREQEEQQGNDGNPLKGKKGEKKQKGKSEKGEDSDGKDGTEKRKDAQGEDGDTDESQTREAGDEDKSEQSDSTDGEGEGNEDGENRPEASEDGEESNDDGSTADGSDETDSGKDEQEQNEGEIDATPEYTPDQASTVRNLEEAMKKFVNNSTVEHAIRIPAVDASKVIVDTDEFNTLLNTATVHKYYANTIGRDVDAAGGMANYIDARAAELFAAMSKDNRRAVDLMCRRFETRRAARNFARESNAKTGRISCRNLSKYKFSEDIFERVTIKRDEKNHGIVILLDWSGSMGGMLRDTVNQLGALLMFCRRAGIAAEVYFFNSMYSKFANDLFVAKNPHLKGQLNSNGEIIDRNHAHRWGMMNGSGQYGQYCQREEAVKFTEHVCNLPAGTVDGNRTAILSAFSLVRVYDQNMSNKKFANTMGRLLFLADIIGGAGENAGVCPPSSLILGTTPLDESILAMRDIVNNFRKSSNTKVTFIALTDGEGMSVINSLNEPQDIADHKARGRRVSKVMIDALNGRRYKVGDRNGNPHDAVVSMFKDATGCDVVGIMMTGTISYCSTFERYMENAYKGKTWEERRKTLAEIDEKFQEEKFVSIPAGNYSQYFFVQVVNKSRAQQNAKAEEMKLDRLKNKKVAATRSFIAAMKRQESNRMFINRLMDIVA